jgi:hypothetical protein
MKSARVMAQIFRLLLSAAILAFAAVPFGATGAEPPIMHRGVTRNWADAWNSHDIAKVLALFAKDIQIDQPENDKPLDYEGARKFFSMCHGLALRREGQNSAHLHLLGSAHRRPPTRDNP